MELEPRLAAWAEAAIGAPVTSARPLTGGYSNDNVLLNERYVLRRYRGRNACAVEAALARRLAGTVPVAEVLAADEAGAVLLSRYMPGCPVDRLLAGADPGTAAALGRAIGATLAAVGTVTFAAPGFFGGGDLAPGPPGIEPASGLDAFVERCLREGNAGGHLTPAEQDALLRHARQAAPDLGALAGRRSLVHADYNPKNLLAAHEGGRWRVTAVLDWEFAFAGPPLFDVANMLRDPGPHAFADAFVAGYRDAGGELPPGWRRVARALDLFSLADFLTRPPEHRYFAKAVAHIRALIRT
ncbi:phosphotransferase [Dactylosporangium sp. CA-139066]|uniref:phosphotransferase n=1 Tax=Dactylosporangium sp. CA-139066 TaxID=3239930 RepID=UPI003D8F5D4F